jgi:phosphate/sulfate permease
LGSLLGFLPQAYIFASLGAGIESQIKKNIEPPTFFELITAFEIYAPIAAFFILLLFAFFIRKIFYKK